MNGSVTRLYVTADEIEAALTALRGPVDRDESIVMVAAQAAADVLRGGRIEQGGEKATHGRHCRCTPCAREDWTNPNLAPCGMHGPTCPAEYAPWPRP